MPETKELDFFILSKNWRLGREWYEAQFARAGRAVAVGEASPRYTMYPWYDGVPARIAQMIPDARLIYVVRDPIERIVSHYVHRQRTYQERFPIERVLAKGPSSYVDASRYAFQIDQYLEYFPRDQMLVILFEKLRDERVVALKAISDFLGINADWTAGAVMGQYNRTEGKIRPRRLTGLAMQSPGWDQAMDLVPERVKKAGRRISHVRLAKPAVPEAIRQELEERLREDVTRLRQYVDGEFDGWGIG